ncbi:hypothetical protein [Algoriphagus sediminis]|uniref:Lipoprotein n=1 Tax=Algoriphagus sediminis TaxID=3057113 RepID=A0ABT7Y961_9BACT|nr:hypothetical protein [Algoriphagus sediminis]MDN3203056.1 hypothetical protein [Algoriphagus sediminis]
MKERTFTFNSNILKVMMNQLRLLSIILILIGSSCISAKQEEPKDEIIIEDQELQAAKSWYESNLVLNENPDEVGQMGSWEGKPIWSNYKIYNQNDGKRVIEVQFDWETVKIPGHLNVEGFNKKYVLQILILYPQKDGDFAAYLLSIYPDEPKELNYADFKEGGYYNHPKSFSGIYHFHRPDGRFSGGWVIEDGVRTRQIKSLKSTK